MGFAGDELKTEIRGLDEDIADAPVAGVTFSIRRPTAADVDLMDETTRASELRRVRDIRLRLQDGIELSIASVDSSLDLADITVELVNAERDGLYEDKDDALTSGITFSAMWPTDVSKYTPIRLRRVYLAMKKKRVELKASMVKAAASLDIPNTVSNEELQAELDALLGDVETASVAGVQVTVTYPRRITDFDATRRRQVFMAIKIRRNLLGSAISASTTTAI